MTGRRPPAKPRFGLSETAPEGRRALWFALLWLVVAGVGAWGAVYIAVHLTSSPALRVVLSLLLVAFSGAALMLASDSLQRWVPERFGGSGGPVQWITTSVVALAAVVVFGAAATLLAPDRPGTSNVVKDLVTDLVLGLIAGLVAVGLVLITSAGLGEAISWVQSQLGLQARAEERWPRPDRNLGRLVRDLGRGAGLGLAGLLLSAACTAIVTTATTNHTGAVDTPTRAIEANPVLTVLLPVIVWFAGTGVVWSLFGLWHGEKLTPHSRLRHGTHATALGLCIGVIMLWFSAAGIEHRTRGSLWHGKAPVPAVSVTAQQASTTSPYLAQQFEPHAWLTADEHWRPTSVSWYARQNPRPNHDPPFCGKGAGCYQISQSCDSADPGTCAPSGANDPALYYRYVTAASDTRDQASSQKIRDWTLIQYWFFYNYDSLHAGAVTQWHQSDWEQVSVLVRRQGASVRPVEVGFSEHCYGALVPAERVRWVDGAHPTVFVANGSHGNYPRPVGVPVRQLRCSLGLVPRYLGVAGLFFSPAVDGSRLEVPIAYLIGLRDRTARARPASALKLVLLDSTPAIESFSGNWGLDNNLSPFGIGRLRASAGPPAPQTQGPWETPFKSMLCNNHWLSTPSEPRSETAWTC